MFIFAHKVLHGVRFHWTDKARERLLARRQPGISSAIQGAVWPDHTVALLTSGMSSSETSLFGYIT
jgi:hypothetical protein